MAAKNSKSYDAIIVGSGPGGASVARELVHSNKNVLMLERGDNDPIKGSLSRWP